MTVPSSRRARADLDGSATSGFQPLAAISLGEPQDADAGAEALLGMRPLLQDDLDQRWAWRPISPACRLRRSGVQSA